DRGLRSTVGVGRDPAIGQQHCPVIHRHGQIRLVGHVVGLRLGEAHPPGDHLAGKGHETIVCAAPNRPETERPMSYSTIAYAVDGPVARITLNRPEALNTIVPPMPDEVQRAVGAATRDGDVKVIVVRGAGRAFCAGYDFGGGFRHWDEHLTTDSRWDPGKDFVTATDPQLSPTQKLMSVWRASKPVIA